MIEHQSEGNFLDQFEQSLINHIELIAVDEEESKKTYFELYQTMRCIGSWIQSQKKATSILIYSKKSFLSIAAIFSCFLENIPYLVCNKNDPENRINYIIKNNKIDLVLHDEEDFSLNESSGIELINIRSIPISTLINFEFSKKIKRPALTFYTSGSTGKPKAVSISIQNIENFVTWSSSFFDIKKQDRIASVAPLYFDLSIFDLFSTLFSGGCICIVPEKIKKFPAAFTQWLDDQHINVLYMVPTAFINLVRHGAWDQRQRTDLKTLLFAGEPYPLHDLNQLRSLHTKAKIFNLYGPTETNVCAYYQIPKQKELKLLQELPLGHSISKANLYLLDEDDQIITELNQPGVLFCTGKCVALGYLKQGSIEHHKNFFDHPLLGKGYKTGDLAKQSEKGFVFLGRTDRQIKKNGYRIDPHEIESYIRKHPDVQEAAVAFHDQQLIAYISTLKTIHPSYIINILMKNLPTHSMPDDYVFVSEFKKTASGKIDYLNLGKQ